jgi:nitrate reductase delta subunit
MDTAVLAAGYRLIAELLLHPDDRDGAKIASLALELGLDDAVGDPIGEFLADSACGSRDEYVQTLELSPPCPLYVGAYLFDEPTSCRGAGTSGRNAYMLELSGLYRHYGFELMGGELPDYLPAVVDFLWISLEHQDRDTIGLRRRLLQHYVLPGLGPLREALDKYHSPYALLVSALTRTVEQDLEHMDDAPAWRPPADASGRITSLPVLSGPDDKTRIGRMLMDQMEQRR